MKLSALIEAVQPLQVIPGAAAETDPEIERICYRSDRVGRDAVFVAIKGASADGHSYAADAAGRGAAAVVAEKPVEIDAPVILVEDARRAMAIMADAVYGAPSSRLTLIGITGTNGKTTTACLLEHILKESGFKTGVIGTIDSHFGNTVMAGTLTTPEAPDLQATLVQMADAGATHVIMEVSSHGIVQNRILGCRFDVGVFTNLSQDHLDFHGNMDAYREAKTAFFTGYMNSRSTAVINCDSEEGIRLAGRLNKGKTLFLGTGAVSGRGGGGDLAYDLGAENLFFDEAGVSGRMVLPSGRIDFHSPLVGRFNLENILCAAGAAYALGADPASMRNAIETFAAVPGRLEKVENASSRHVFVDYSHTPEALENVLGALRGIVPGRLICIFGCGGDRDRGKRPQMGEIAAALADLAIVTSDNPRTEHPDAIIADILAGVRRTGSTEIERGRLDSRFENGSYTVVPDRSSAIDLGIGLSRPGDGVLIAGKGHETYQIIGRKTIDFDDRVHAKTALAQYGMN